MFLLTTCCLIITLLATMVAMTITGDEMANGRFVAYYRVSTDRQGASGLGLEAQQAAVVGYLNGGHWELVADFTEVESGRKNDRPELAKALATCRAHNATLIIAKLDRLARNVAFVSNLMEAGVEFTAVDFPTANKLTIHVLAAVAEHEAKMISERTKSALAAAKARGVKLGGDRGSFMQHADAGRAKGRESRSIAAMAKAADLAGVIASVQADGITSAAGVARVLNQRGVPTASGSGSWQAATVLRVLARVQAE